MQEDAKHVFYSICCGVIVVLLEDSIVDIDLSFLSLTLACLAIILGVISFIRIEATVKKLKHIRNLHVLLAQKLDVHVEGYDPVTDSCVDSLIDAGFHPASFGTPQDIFDSSKTIDSLGYENGIKKLQEKYG